MERIDAERAGRARTPGRGGAALVRHNERTKALSLEALRTTGGALRGTREGIGPVLDRWWCGFMAVLVVGLGLGWPLVSWISPVAQHGARLEPWWCASLALLFLGVGLARAGACPSESANRPSGGLLARRLGAARCAAYPGSACWLLPRLARWEPRCWRSWAAGPRGACCLRCCWEAASLRWRRSRGWGYKVGPRGWSEGFVCSRRPR